MPEEQRRARGTIDSCSSSAWFPPHPCHPRQSSCRCVGPTGTRRTAGSSTAHAERMSNAEFAENCSRCTTALSRIARRGQKQHGSMPSASCHPITSAPSAPSSSLRELFTMPEEPRHARGTIVSCSSSVWFPPHPCHPRQSSCRCVGHTGTRRTAGSSTAHAERKSNAEFAKNCSRCTTTLSRITRRGQKQHGSMQSASCHQITSAAPAPSSSLHELFTMPEELRRARVTIVSCSSSVWFPPHPCHPRQSSCRCVGHTGTRRTAGSSTAHAERKSNAEFAENCSRCLVTRSPLRPLRPHPLCVSCSRCQKYRGMHGLRSFHVVQPCGFRRIPQRQQTTWPAAAPDPA